MNKYILWYMVTHYTFTLYLSIKQNRKSSLWNSSLLLDEIFRRFIFLNQHHSPREHDLSSRPTRKLIATETWCAISYLLLLTLFPRGNVISLWSTSKILLTHQITTPILQSVSVPDSYVWDSCSFQFDYIPFILLHFLYFMLIDIYIWGIYIPSIKWWVHRKQDMYLTNLYSHLTAKIFFLLRQNLNPFTFLHIYPYIAFTDI